MTMQHIKNKHKEISIITILFFQIKQQPNCNLKKEEEVELKIIITHQQSH